MPRARSFRVAMIGVGLAVVTVALFASVRSHAFLNYDDDVYVTANPHVTNGLSADAVLWALTSFDAANWHPLTWMSHLLDVQMFGLDAGGHHLTSVLLHAANALVLFLVLIKMTGAVWRPALVAALFAIHPLHVESVAWVAERKDVLSTLFWLLTLWAWLAWLESKTAARYAAVLALFALGLMSKPMLVTLPFTLLLIDYWPLKRAMWPPLLKEKAPLFAMSAVSCVVTVFAQRSGGAIVSLQRFTFSERIANAVLAYSGYLGKTFWPASLAIFYPHPHARLMSWTVVACAVMLAGVTVLVLGPGRSHRVLVFAWLWYLGTLVPVIGLVQAGEQSMADRYTYMPLLGIFIAVAWGLGALAEHGAALRYVAIATSAVVLVTLSVVTRAQVGYWSDNKTLLEHALAVTKDNFVAHNNLAGVLIQEGQIPEAIDQLEQALRVDPTSVRVRYNLANLLTRAHRNGEAIEQYSELLRQEPRATEVAARLAQLLTEAGRLPDAIETYRKIVAIDPNRADIRNNLGIALAEANRMPEAVAEFKEAVRINPDFPGARENLERAQDALRQRP